GSGMLLVDVTGGAQGWLPGPVSSNVAWSPDGRTLAWSPDPDAPGSPAGVVELCLRHRAGVGRAPVPGRPRQVG
ncbi:MAG: hypothetical protein GXX94_05580, partial [Chloroflexi bacterium]|nr:hypothetical protein [Chloroflexota bacterium]